MESNSADLSMLPDDCSGFPILPMPFNSISFPKVISQLPLMANEIAGVISHNDKGRNFLISKDSPGIPGNFFIEFPLEKWSPKFFGKFGKSVRGWKAGRANCYGCSLLCVVS